MTGDGGPSVALLCDADPTIGLGHLSRCLALAEAMAECGAAPRIVGRVAADFHGMVEDAGIPLVAIRDPFGTAAGRRQRHRTIDDLVADLAVVDSYDADSADLAAFGRGRPVCCIDDFGRLGAYPCAAILNFTVAADALSYPDGPVRLLGPRWFLTRRALRILRRDGTESPSGGPVRRVLVSVGGEDRTGVTTGLVRAVGQAAPGVAVDVVLGRARAGGSALDDALATTGAGSSLTVAAPSLADHLGRSDLVLSGGGLTKYEAAYVGRPTAVVDQTEEQARETRQFVQAGLAVALGLPPLDEAGLTAVISGLITNGAERRQLAERGLRTFPSDPTLDAAKRLLRLVQDCADGPRG